MEPIRSQFQLGSGKLGFLESVHLDGIGFDPTRSRGTPLNPSTTTALLPVSRVGSAGVPTAWAENGQLLDWPVWLEDSILADDHLAPLRAGLLRHPALAETGSIEKLRRMYSQIEHRLNFHR